MDRDISTWLFDIIQSINEISSYFKHDSYKFNDYITDLKTKRAVERNIEIIGEAINRILKKRSKFQNRKFSTDCWH
jgi:uncharacterized protein with HEPN domain